MRYFFTLSMLIISAGLPAQELSEYKWQSRILLVSGTQADMSQINKQIARLNNDKDGLVERKLILFKVLPTKYQNVKEQNWTDSRYLFKRFAKGKLTFQVILIGLDGSVKLRQQDFLSRQQLYKTIDAMPMRQAELRRKK